MSIFALQHSNPVTYTHTTYTHTHTDTDTHTHSFLILSSIPFESKRLCCTVGPHCLSVLNIIVCFYEPQTPHPSHFFLLGLTSTLSFCYTAMLCFIGKQSCVVTRQGTIASVKHFFHLILGWDYTKHSSYQ